MHLHWHFPSPEILAWDLIHREIITLMFYEFSMDFFLGGGLKLCVKCCADSQIANVDRSDA